MIRLLAAALLAAGAGCAAYDYDGRYRYINSLMRMESPAEMTTRQLYEHRRYWAAQQAHYLDLLMQRHPTCEPVSTTAARAAGAGLAVSASTSSGLLYLAPRIVDGRRCTYGSTRRVDCRRYIRANAFLLLDPSQACGRYGS